MEVNVNRVSGCCRTREQAPIETLETIATNHSEQMLDVQFDSDSAVRAAAAAVEAAPRLDAVVVVCPLLVAQTRCLSATAAEVDST